ncbi:hypothetical protein BCON_0063g00010 [Botryotinia convoluta]|uniref:Heterokaryon incompatibility domain-containing protein n=1 Tax=Botryotinia convoluta TaxID=54673 RepID=A0A4Z1IAD8_9HELO|nr:hypothetical protein BCON_0063g00010 [Botryotinia convoluta]
MSSAEKRSGFDSDGGTDRKRLRSELGANESDAMGRLSSDVGWTDAVEMGGVCAAQERGNPEVLVEVDDADTIEHSEIDYGSNNDPSTNHSSHDPGQDFGIKRDTDEGREEPFRENEGHKHTEAYLLDNTDGHNVSSGSDLDVEKYDDEVPLVEYEENEQESSGDSQSDYSGTVFETNNSLVVRWPIKDCQGSKESMESENEINTTTTEVLNPELCKFCRVFFNTWSSVCDFLSKRRRSSILFSAHHDTISGLKESASSGCHLCALFLSISYAGWRNDDFHAHEAGNHLSHDQLKPYRIIFQHQGISRGDNRCRIEKLWNISLDFWMFKYVFRCRKPAHVMMILDDISDSESWKRECYTNTNLGQNGWENFQLGCTKESTGLVRAWLRECCLSHSACRQQEETSALPTRLIKIDCQEIRLCISANENCSKYATLSHCWGEAEVLRLQKDNLQAFLEKIPYDELCKSFRDAIDIARVLGFSWLWIDSLCIIQGDSVDWSKEASRMATVYGRSSLNFAATAAPDGTIGCLFERDLSYTGPHKVEVKINHQKEIYNIVDMHLYRNNIANAALTRRAWAFQERILAPRTLHFAETQVFWECRSKQACETFPDTLPEAICAGPLYLSKHEFQSWSKIILVYTNCSLTNESDRLIAIGGVARQFQKKNGDKYFAGLWQARLKEQMCWYIDRYITKIPRENTWRAPSWSWAAVKQPVSIFDDTAVFAEACIDITKVDITLEHDDPFGGVKRGVLNLRSKSMIICEMESPLDKYSGRSIGKISIKSYDLKWDYEDCGSEGFCHSILVLPVGILEHGGIGGLLLRHTDQENGQYERLGRFQLRTYFDDYKVMSRAMNLAQDKQFEELGLGDVLPSEKDYISTDVDEDGITWYTISIV